MAPGSGAITLRMSVSQDVPSSIGTMAGKLPRKSSIVCGFAAPLALEAGASEQRKTHIDGGRVQRVGGAGQIGPKPVRRVETAGRDNERRGESGIEARAPHPLPFSRREKGDQVCPTTGLG